MQSLTDTDPAQPAPLNLESQADLPPAFPTMCAEVTLACESFTSTYFPILFPILFPITPPFPILTFQPFLTLLSLLPEGKPGLPTGKEGFLFAQGQGHAGDSEEGSWAWRGRADSCLLGGQSKPLLRQPKAGAALSSWSDAVVGQGGQPRALKSQAPPQ